MSPRQAQQLSCWGDNVRTFAVRGTFDDCQRIVKTAMRDPALRATHEFSSANSINLGRLLPQTVYYAAASLQLWRSAQRKSNFIVPSGNLGNVVACVTARDMGLPIGDIVLATNANLTVTGLPARRRVAAPDRASRRSLRRWMSAIRRTWSGFERGVSTVEQLRTRVSAYSVTDEQIRSTIREDAEKSGRVWCPHSATAAFVYRTVAKQRPADHWVIVATAHPAKFEEVVEPLIGRAVPVPPSLARLLELPRHDVEIDPTLDALQNALSPA